jgi:hypothetical protein
MRRPRMKTRFAVYLFIAMLCLACGKTSNQGASRVVQPFANAGENALLAVLTDPRSAEYIACYRDADSSYEIHPGGDAILLVPLANIVEIAVHALAYDENAGEFTITDTPYAFSGKLGEPIRLIAFLSEGIPSLKLVAAVPGMWAEWLITYDGRGMEGVRFLIGTPD